MKLYRYFILFSILLIVISSTNAEPLKIVCSTDNSKESLHVAALEKFGDLVKEYSSGKLVAEIHYRGSEEFPAIRGEEVNVNMVMFGQGGVHVTVVAAGNVSQKVKILNFLMLPYMFPDIQSAEKLFQSDYYYSDILAPNSWASSSAFFL